MSPATSRAATAKAGSSRTVRRRRHRSEATRSHPAVFDPRVPREREMRPDRHRREQPPRDRAAGCATSAQHPSPRSFRSSRRSHDFANCQSRLTVSGDTSRASRGLLDAHSTKETQFDDAAFSAVDLASACRARSSATRSGARSTATSAVSSSEIIAAPPPRFRYRFDRATSTENATHQSRRCRKEMGLPSRHSICPNADAGRR